jgi:hypothetical protein
LCLVLLERDGRPGTHLLLDGRTKRNGRTRDSKFARIFFILSDLSFHLQLLSNPTVSEFVQYLLDLQKMRLTAILFRNPRMQGRQPSKEKFFDRLPIFRLTSVRVSVLPVFDSPSLMVFSMQMTFGRSRNCWSLARPSFEKGLVQGAWGRKMKPMYNRMVRIKFAIYPTGSVEEALHTFQLRITRLEGGLSPFGLTYESFVENLAKVSQCWSCGSKSINKSGTEACK